VVAAVDRATLIDMNKKFKIIASLIFAVAIVGYITAQQTMNKDAVISVKDAHAQLMNDTSIVLLDVRTFEEHYSERIGNTPLIPVQELEQRVHELDSLKNQTIIVYCRSGHRSGVATTLLRKKGFKAMSMQGGINQWKLEQFETITGTN
jgi:rhodanese-related sulfurtransferase